MFPFLNINKSLFTYSLIFLLLIPIFGFNFFLSLAGNILLLVFLVPLLILLISLISFNSLKSKVNVCSRCGSISIGVNSICINCGEDNSNMNSNNFENFKKPSETTIEVKAEEIQ